MVNAECRKLLDQLIPADQRTTGLLKADAAQTSPAQLLDELRTLPFLTDKRVVLLKDADSFVSQNRQLLENYFDKPSPTGILILAVSSWPATTKLAKKLAKAGKLISITQPKPWQLPQRLTQYAHDAYDKNLTQSAAQLLVELTGDNLAALYSEVDKLALFVDAESTITPRHVETLIGHNRLFNSFAVIDAILAGNIAQAVDRLRKMFDADNSTEFSFIGAFAFHLRRMFNAKALLNQGISPTDVASKLRIWGNKAGFFAQLRKVSLNQIAANLQVLAQIDYQIKTGQTKPKVAAEQLVFKLAGK